MPYISSVWRIRISLGFAMGEDLLAERLGGIALVCPVEGGVEASSCNFVAWGIRELPEKLGRLNCLHEHTNPNRIRRGWTAAAGAMVVADLAARSIGGCPRAPGFNPRGIEGVSPVAG